tara:strand:- start:54 stop:953 length:900 start_codon:yes stop_codon:yes gene_type:complete
MSKNIIVKISEGIGNQLFMYSNAYALSKKNNYNLLIDNTSGYFKDHNKVRLFLLDKFEVNLNIAPKNYKICDFSSYIKFNFLKKIQRFSKDNVFINESLDVNKMTYFNIISLPLNKNNFFIGGNFESEKYFVDYKENLLNVLRVKKNFVDSDNQYINLLKSSNSVSICIRQNRYSERKKQDFRKSIKFTKDTLSYVYKAISIIKSKIPNPQFFVWSDYTYNLDSFFDKKEFTFIDNKKNKSLNDFNLFRYSKHFIVGPTTFHWWGAWLNTYSNKLCLRPKNINPSNNSDFWPESWIKID